MIIYTAFYAPFRTAFMNYESSAFLLMFETVTDGLMAFDIILSFLLPYERNDGSIERNVKMIAKRYIKEFLLIDIIAILPT